MLPRFCSGKIGHWTRTQEEPVFIRRPQSHPALQGVLAAPRAPQAFLDLLLEIWIPEFRGESRWDKIPPIFLKVPQVFAICRQVPENLHGVPLTGSLPDHLQIIPSNLQVPVNARLHSPKVKKKKKYILSRLTWNGKLVTLRLSMNKPQATCAKAKSQMRSHHGTEHHPCSPRHPA